MIQMLLTICVASSIQAAELNFQNVLEQERAWAGLTSKKVKNNEIEWTYSEGGNPQKPTLLLLHGLSGTRDNWNRVARYLTANYHVIIPDLPAHGETIVEDQFDLSIPNLTEKLRRFIDAAKLDPNLHIAGHSMGGAIAMLYSAQYPLGVKSLLLVDSAGVFKSSNTVYLKDTAKLAELVVRKTGDFDRVMKIVMQSPPFIPQELKIGQEKLMIVQSKQTNKMVEQLQKMATLYTPESFALAGRGIDAPVFIIWGKQDQIINVEVAEELRRLFKKAEKPLILDHVGHMPILEAEQLIALPYLKFLSTVQ
ncbi:alpha/beta fold hydrolase [Acinetobacter sp. YH12140]|uniref:alpha/beta fold hydrolase n=1 Tax=Acinetobacter sp. YH12140 TaxID=2601124 RepID=UPI00211EA27E|nr:alpha/beta hydrolase [Acinetobacter sp. YH12140]